MPDQVDWRAMGHDTTAGHAVGRLLRDQREALGLDVPEVAKSLRIRPAYIEAIDQGRFDALPGAAYVVAFLRAYARHLGLDPQQVLTAYQLSGSVPIERPISLPADFPVAEKRAPIGLAVLTVLLVIGAGYAVWSYLPRQQAIVAEKVPPVPDRLLASGPSTSETAARRAEAPPVVTATSRAEKTDRAAKAETAAPSPAALAPTAPVQQAQDVPAPGARQEAVVAPPPAVIAVPAAPPPVMMSAPSAGQALAAQPAAVDTQRTVPTPDPQQAVARPAPPASTDSAMVVATPTKSDTQVIVRSNSWIELRSPNGDVLTQTYVRAGESYVVPAGIAYRIIQAH
jgi:cytoskeleton protein RodZ